MQAPVNVMRYAILFGAVLAAAPPGGERPSPAEVPGDLDRVLFDLTVRALVADTTVPDLRIDPRPLRPDPGLVTLHAFNLAPDRVILGSWQDPFARGVENEIDSRRAALRLLGVTEAQGIPEVACPPVMAPPTPELQEEKARWCPQVAFRNALIALPRTGGAYWPPSVDERAKYAGRLVYTVRVLQRLFYPQGQMEASHDYVFEYQADGWVLLERRGLLIIE